MQCKAFLLYACTVVYANDRSDIEAGTCSDVNKSCVDEVKKRTLFSH